MSKLLSVRISLPLVLLLCLTVILGIWFYGTQNKDFLTPPSEEHLAEVRAQVVSSLPPADQPEEKTPTPSTPPPPPATEEPAKPTIDLGDLSSPPALNEYADLPESNAIRFCELAAALETAGETQRALLAWERVLDTGNPDSSQIIRAIASIRRLRPTVPVWNTNSAKSTVISLQGSTGKKLVSALTPILQETSRELEIASSGILKINTITDANLDPKASKSTTVALCIKGSVQNSRSTDALSFTDSTPETLRKDVQKNVLQILRLQLKLSPAPINEAEPMEAIQTQITRLQWKNLGTILNQITEKTPPTPTTAQKPTTKPAEKPKTNPEKPAAKPARR